MTPEAFVEAARSYVGVKWKHQGRSRRGVDCIGLIVLAARDIGIPAPVEAVYGRIANYFELKEVLCRFTTRVGSPSLGCVLLYKEGSVLHLGIYSGPNMAIQALNTVGRVIESTINFRISQSWAPRWNSFS